MSKIAIDVHDVTCDLVGGFVDAHNAFYPETPLTVEGVTDWDWRKVIGTRGQEIFTNLFTPDLQAKLKPVFGSHDAAAKLWDAGHKTFYATATYGPMADAAYKWLKEWGFISAGEGYGRFMTIQDKSLIRADFLIDDKPENVEAFAKTRQGISILFDRPWNRKFNWLRARDWDDVVHLIEYHSQNLNAGVKLQQEVNLKQFQPDRLHGVPAEYGTFLATAGLAQAKTPAQQIAALLNGVGPEVEAKANEKGGIQSAIPFRFDLVDPTVLFVLANILAEGAAKYGEWNWRKLDLNSNLNHALTHIYAYLAGDEQDDHLGHALCRLMFAKSIQHNPDPKNLMDPAK